MMKHVTWACSTALILVAALSHPGVAAAHGTASGEDDPCKRQVGERVIHFNAYQPQYQLKDQYCTDIPKEGETFLVVDLVDPALRSEPVGMRVVKGNGSNEGRRSDCGRYSSEHPPGRSAERRSQAGRGPVYGHHCVGEAESDEASAVSLAGAHDRLSAAGAAPWPSHCWACCSWPGSGTSLYDRRGCGIGGLSAVRRKPGAPAREHMVYKWEKVQVCNSDIDRTSKERTKPMTSPNRYLTSWESFWSTSTGDTWRNLLGCRSRSCGPTRFGAVPRLCRPAAPVDRSGMWQRNANALSGGSFRQGDWH